MPRDHAARGAALAQPAAVLARRDAGVGTTLTVHRLGRDVIWRGQAEHAAFAAREPCLAL